MLPSAVVRRLATRRQPADLVRLQHVFSVQFGFKEVI